MPRFTQPDTIIPNPANSQDWNRYSYVRNNPIRYNDPTGHCPDAGCWEMLGPVLRELTGQAPPGTAAQRQAELDELTARSMRERLSSLSPTERAYHNDLQDRTYTTVCETLGRADCTLTAGSLTDWFVNPLLDTARRYAQCSGDLACASALFIVTALGSVVTYGLCVGSFLVLCGVGVGLTAAAQDVVMDATLDNEVNPGAVLCGGVVSGATGGLVDGDHLPGWSSEVAPLVCSVP